jgi:hypothetical protein
MRGMPTSGSRDTGSWPRIIAASVVSSRAVGRVSRFFRMGMLLLGSIIHSDGDSQVTI